MKEWTISIEAASDRADEAMADRLVEELSQYSAAGYGYGNGRDDDGHGRHAGPRRQRRTGDFVRVASTALTRVEVEVAA
jgi:hypothetical protein